MASFAIDDDFIPTLGIAMVAGRNLSRNIAADQKNRAFIINEAGVTHLGWPSPEEALGKKLVQRNRSSGTIIGVVKDFHVQSLYQQIEPLIFRMSSGFSYLLVRLRPSWNVRTLDFLKEKWDTYVPTTPFEYVFLDDYFERQYRADQTRGQILGGFTFLALFIAALGLFGLAAFAAEQRTKEIGIRRVLGASATNITRLLSTEFLKPILLANLIAWPIAYYAMNQWLQNFAYRIDLSIGIFLLSGLIALFIAFFTVSYQTLKAARANLVDALRYE